MRRALAITILLLAVLAPAAAHGATTYVVRGAGFGHGVGMSQYGAYGMAQKGFGFGRILAHYYQGTELSPAPSRPIRILLQASDPYVRFRGATRAPGGKARSRTTTYIARRARSGRVSLSGGGRRIGPFSAPLLVNG